MLNRCEVFAKPNKILFYKAVYNIPSLNANFEIQNASLTILKRDWHSSVIAISDLWIEYNGFQGKLSINHEKMTLNYYISWVTHEFFDSALTRVALMQNETLSTIESYVFLVCAPHLHFLLQACIVEVTVSLTMVRLSASYLSKVSVGLTV